MSGGAMPFMLLCGSLFFALAGVLIRAVRWRQGAAASVPVLSGLLSFPKRYLVDVHHIVMRTPLAARMHMCAAGGFLASIALILLVHGFDLHPAFAWALLAMLTLQALGGLMAILRRSPKPNTLSGGGFSHLGYALIAFALFFGFATLPKLGGVEPIDWLSPAPLLLLLAGLYSCVILIVGLAGGPIKHSLYGALHLAFHPRPARFDQPKTQKALRPLNLDAPKLGLETPQDFAWNRLLSFDACVQCGKCEDACPAFAAELPLNPKALIQDLVRAQAPVVPAPYHGSPHPHQNTTKTAGMTQPLVGQNGAVSAETLWACTTCRACVETCPMMIEHVDAIVDLRRFQTLELGETPGKGPETLDHLRGADNPVGAPATARHDWLVDLNVPILSEVKACKTLLWLGGGAFELRTQATLRALVKLLQYAGEDFAILGDEELDCGDVARRLGDEALFQSLAKRNLDTLARYRFDRIVTADPHALHALRKEYVDFGPQLSALHHSQLLSELVATGRLDFELTPMGTLTYHDPCYLGRYNDIVEPPRMLLKALGYTIREMEKSGMQSFCCGGGGAAPMTDVAGKKRIPDIRMAQARATGVDIVAAACPGCMTMLEGVTGEQPDVRDVAELLLDAVEAKHGS